MRPYDSVQKKDWHLKKDDPSRKSKSGQSQTIKRCNKRRKTRARRMGKKMVKFFG